METDNPTVKMIMQRQKWEVEYMAMGRKIPVEDNKLELAKKIARYDDERLRKVIFGG